jgi:hypothetical protein
VISAPGTISVDATGPDGANVEYAPLTVTDNCPGVTVDSAPASGQTFVIGDTTVTATATDQAGNTTGASFVVHVNGATEQLAALALAVTGVGSGNSLTASVATAQRQVAAGRTHEACQSMNVFLKKVQVQTPRSIDRTTADALTTDAQRLRAVLGC